jgi:hypothetical protein
MSVTLLYIVGGEEKISKAISWRGLIFEMRCANSNNIISPLPHLGHGGGVGERASLVSHIPLTEQIVTQKG